MDAHARQRLPFTGVHRVVRRYLEPVQDVLIVALSLALLAAMMRSLVVLVQHAIAPSVPVRLVLGETMFVLVLLELLRLVVIYLQDHHVSVDVMVEVTIVSILREVLIQGIDELATLQLLALTAFILALGLLLRFGDLRISQRRVRRHPRPSPRRDHGPARVPAP